MKKELNNKSHSIFPPQEEFERVVKRAQKSDKRTNMGLPPNANEIDRAKYKLCKDILRYKHDKKLSNKEIANKLKLSITKTEVILYSHYHELTLDELINYANSLNLPFEVKIHSSYGQQKNTAEAR